MFSRYLSSSRFFASMAVRGPNDNPTDAGWGNEPEFKQAAQDVKQLGMAPLVILRAASALAQALSVDLDLVNYMTGLFGGGTVYYEFGNEPARVLGAAGLHAERIHRGREADRGAVRRDPGQHPTTLYIDSVTWG